MRGELDFQDVWFSCLVASCLSSIYCLVIPFLSMVIEAEFGPRLVLNRRLSYCWV